MENCQIIGIDLQQNRVHAARLKYSARGWHYLCARGEEIPLADGSVDGVFCNVALPYMHIPRTLAEVHRVLVPGGWLKASLHTLSFTWNELRKALPQPKASLFRAFVLLNGIFLAFFRGRDLFGESRRVLPDGCGDADGLTPVWVYGGEFLPRGQRFLMDARRDDGVERRATVAA